MQFNDDYHRPTWNRTNQEGMLCMCDNDQLDQRRGRDPPWKEKKKVKILEANGKMYDSHDVVGKGSNSNSDILYIK